MAKLKTHPPFSGATVHKWLHMFSCILAKFVAKVVSTCVTTIYSTSTHFIRLKITTRKHVGTGCVAFSKDCERDATVKTVVIGH